MPSPAPGSTDDVLFYAPLRPVARALCGTLSPNAITLVGIVPSALVVVAIAQRKVALALAAFVVRYVFDCLDGSVARECGQTSDVGRWLDWAVDAVQTVAIVAALAATYTDVSPLLAGAAAAAMIPCATRGALLVHDDLFLWEFGLLLGALTLGEHSIHSRE